MEESGQLRASERPDESRVHKFRPQRSVDNYQDDGYRHNVLFLFFFGVLIIVETWCIVLQCNVIMKTHQFKALSTKSAVPKRREVSQF